MGFQFRKSKNFGPIHLNFSKSGVGVSAGVKGFRVSKRAKGGVTATASIPGTGVSYSKTIIPAKGKGKTAKKAASGEAAPTAGRSAGLYVGIALCVLLAALVALLVYALFFKG